jgi:hypothetical protein
VTARTILKPSTALWLIAAAAACGGGEGPLSVQIEARPVSRELVRAESLTSVESASHTIRVRQTIRVPDGCRALRGDLLHAGGQLTLRVHASPDGRPCRPEESYLAYRASIRGLAPGRYDLRVVHAPAARRRLPQVVLEHPVVVMERAVEVP